MLVNNVSQYKPKHNPVKGGNKLSDTVDSERTYVLDNDGWVEADGHLIWTNEDLYELVGFELVDGIMCYYFEFLD